MIKSKSIFMFVVICAIPVALYYGVDSITSLNIFPKGISSGEEYLNLLDRFGVPKVLKSSKMKLVKRGVSVIPGKGSRFNINTVLGESRKLPKIKEPTPAKKTNGKAGINNNTSKSANSEKGLVQQLEPDQGAIDKIFSGFTGYVSSLENELSKGLEEEGTEPQYSNERNKIKTSQFGKTRTAQKIVNAKFTKDKFKQKAIIDDAKFYRADVYEAKLLVCFKKTYVYRIFVLKEKFYKCSFPKKTSFYTYSVENDFSVIYIPGGLSDEQFKQILNNKKSNNKFLAFFENWKPRRSKISFDKFYRLYKFTIPSSTTMFLENKNLIFYGKNVHENDTLLRVLERIIKKNILK